MDYAYFDTSALIKRYVDEPGRPEVLRLLRKNQCVVSAVLPVEVRSALRRRVGFDAKRVPGILKRLAADRAYWTSRAGRLPIASRRSIRVRQIHKRVRTLGIWSGRLDSNQRPPAPKAGALPGCATPRL